MNTSTNGFKLLLLIGFSIAFASNAMQENELSVIGEDGVYEHLRTYARVTGMVPGVLIANKYDQWLNAILKGHPTLEDEEMMFLTQASGKSLDEIKLDLRSILNTRNHRHDEPTQKKGGFFYYHDERK